jgi:hypothetical protein
MFDIFICYSRKEIDFIDCLNIALKSIKLSVWIDQEKIFNESDWYSLVKRAIEESSLCLIVVNQDLLKSISCFMEVQRIISLQKPTILIFRSGILSIPKYLSELNLIYSCDSDSLIKSYDVLLNEILKFRESQNSASK